MPDKSIAKPLRAPNGESPVRYDPRTITRSPGFWRGALATRHELEADPGRTTLVHRLLAAAEDGRDPTATEDYRAWLAHRRGVK